MLAAGVTIATPAGAATNPTEIFVSGGTDTSCGNANLVTVRTGVGGTGTSVTGISWTTSTDRLRVTNECTQTIYLKMFANSTEVLQLRMTVFANNFDITQALGTSVTSIKIYRDSSYTNLIATLNAVAPGGGGGTNNGDTASGSATGTPVEVSLSLDLAASGASCAEGPAASGLIGTWLTLPTAGDCSSTTNPKAKLLGWSTNANFPVELAQSQVNRGWGAIDEVFGEVRMIFIPAGQATYVSGPGSLFPIWAN